MTEPKLNRILAAKLAASRAPHTNVALDKAIAATPTALANTKSYNLPLVCKYSGITVGNLTIATVAGHMPMIGQWKESMVLHPLFSLADTALLQFSRNSWFRFCAFTAEEAIDDTITAKQEQLLRVATLAMLHKMTDIRQDVPWLPTWPDVTRNWNSILSLSYWKNYLESQRFKFPAIRISKLEPEVDLTTYLQLCWQVKKEYETKVNERIEREKLESAEKALKVLRDDLAGKTPRSLKLLWRWYISHLPARYEADSEGWMHTIFFSKDADNLQNKFTIADIDLYEQIFLCECPTGSSLSHAFLDILRSKRQILENHFDTFEILVPESIKQGAADGSISTVEPKLGDFKNKVGYMIAHAKWRLAHNSAALSKNMDAAIARSNKVSVNASFVPELPFDFGNSKSKRAAAVEDMDADDDSDTDTFDAADNSVTSLDE